MSISDISRITRGALHLHFDPVRSRQFEISFDDWPGEVVYFSERVRSAVVKVSLPMPRGVSTGARGAEHEKLRVRRPLHFLNVAAVLTVWRLEVLGRAHSTLHVVNFDARFIEWRVDMLSDR